MSNRPDSSGLLPLDPLAFGQSSEQTVELRQTHIGWVYLVGPHAFKIKKPVRFDFLDFTTIEKRLWACERELQFNRRLAPAMYYGLQPVLESDSGSRRVALPDRPARASEHIIDWAVWMDRLPSDRMLDILLQQDAVEREQLVQVADALCGLYLAGHGRLAPGGLGDLATVQANIEENLSEGQTLDRALLPEGALRLLERRARRFISKYGGIIQERARTGYVVEAHGDLRAENICLPRNSTPILFDCIEFNDRFRICDSAMDVAFLAMELDACQRRDLRDAFLERYQTLCDPHLDSRLLNFYLGYRAFVKAKVAAWISADPQVGLEQRASAARQARAVFELAVRYALQDEPALLVFCGPAGSGKSTLAHLLAQRLNCTHLSTDHIRNEIIPASLSQAERYAPEQSFRVYQELFGRAAAQLASSRLAIMDGTFSTAGTRARAVKIARDRGVPSVLIWADCGPASIRDHLARRTETQESFASEAGLEIALRQYANFDRPKERESFSGICRIDTALPEATAVAAAWDCALKILAEHLPG